MKPKFLNRKPEFNELKTAINKQVIADKGRIILLYSKIGIGKARLVEEFVSKYYPISLKIHIKTPVSKNGITPPYQYFNAIFDKLSSFLNSSEKMCTTLTPGFNIGGLSTSVSVELMSAFPKTITKKLKIIKKFFAKYKQNIIITVENVQSIDSESLDLIKSLLHVTPNVFMFLQYTTDSQPDYSDLNNLFEFLSEFSVYNYPVEIKQMEDKHIVQIMEDITDNTQDNALVHEYYLKYNGNLDALIILLNQKKSTDVNAITYSSISNLNISKEAHFVLYIVLFYGKEMYIDEMRNLLIRYGDATWNSNRITTVVTELQGYNLVALENDQIVLENFVIKMLENSVHTYIAQAAFGIVEEDCQQHLNDHKMRIEYIYKLLYMYLLFNDEQVISLMPYIKRFLVDTRNIKRVLSQLESIGNYGMFDSLLKEKLVIGIVDILYAVGERELAIEKLKLIFQPGNIQHEMFQLALNASLNSPDFTDNYHQIHDNYNNLPRVLLYCEYINLYYKMKYQTSEEAKLCAKEILKNREYTNYIEYYFVLKNYSTYANNHTAIHMLQKCINAFESFKRKDLVTRTKLTLAMRNANIGNLGIARDILLEAEDENDYACRECYFLNNLSVIDLLEGDFDEGVEENLKNALLFSPSEYEKGIILCNLLIYYCQTHKPDRAANIAVELESPKYSKYAFEQYKHILHFNLYYYYTQIDNQIKSHHHYTILEKLYVVAPSDLKDYMDATLFHKKTLSPDHRRFFYSKFPYRADYIGYWQLEVPNLKNYCVKAFSMSNKNIFE